MNTERFFEGPGQSEMSTYVWEIALILLGAFLLGYLLRYLLNSKYKTRIAELEDELNSLKSEENLVVASPEVDTTAFESKIKAQQSEISSLNTKLSECYSKKIKAETELEGLKASSVVTESKVKEVAVAKVSGSIGSQKDDLKKIEGVGPKIEGLLNADGIYTFKQVIASSVDRIKGILIAAGPNYGVHDPSTWGEQSKLADAGKWEALDALQEELKGGKRKKR